MLSSIFLSRKIYSSVLLSKLKHCFQILYALGGEVFESSKNVVSFLKGRFQDHEAPQYHIKEILETELSEERTKRQKMKFPTIKGSSLFHVAIFKPKSEKFKASTRLCLCEQCLIEYGSCPLFKEYELQVQAITTPSLRSNLASPVDESSEDALSDFVSVGTYVAVAASISSPDTVWLIKVNEINRIDHQNVSVDSFGFKVAANVMHLSGNFLEKDEKKSTKTENVYNLSKKDTFFFKESIVYPYVNIRECKKGLSLALKDYTDILYHIEANAFAHL